MSEANERQFDIHGDEDTTKYCDCGKILLGHFTIMCSCNKQFCTADHATLWHADERAKKIEEIKQKHSNMEREVKN